jgi:ectoine hydroxylase-related dioxygenase (phytanoyl-CoA dioxygenase family)
MNMSNKIPDASYGILERNISASTMDLAAESIRNIGYAVLDAGYSKSDLDRLSDDFNRSRERYINQFGEQRLRDLGEYFTVRALLTHGSDLFLKLALNDTLHAVLKKTITGKYILNQQNGVINPPRESYGQGSWHRDLPYQHFVSSRPIAVNALFCIDDFTQTNGATFVLPASHKFEAFPSKEYIQQNAIQVEAKKGDFILLDCMLFHSGGFNATHSERRAVNHVFNIPYFKQQINIPASMEASKISTEAREILGFGFHEPASINEFFTSRESRK